MFGWRRLDLSTSSAKDVDKFLEESSPSKLSMQDGIAWIAVGFSARDRAETDTDDVALEEDFEELKSSGDVTKEAVLELGVQHGMLSAKWLFFVTPSDMAKENVWNKVVRGMHQGKISAISAKISPRNSQSPTHVICVYTESFQDTEAVHRLHGELRDCCGIQNIMYFKTDVYTHLGIYNKNPWGLSPSLYTSRWMPGLGQAEIQEN